MEGLSSRLWKPGGRETPEVVLGTQQVPWGGPAVLQETFTSSTGMTCSICSEAGAPANEAAVQKRMGANSRPGGRQPPLPSTCSHQAKKPPAYGAEAEEGSVESCGQGTEVWSCRSSTKDGRGPGHLAVGSQAMHCTLGECGCAGRRGRWLQASLPPGPFCATQGNLTPATLLQIAHHLPLLAA